MEAQLALAVRDVVSGVATIEREQAQVANRRALFNQSAANLKRRRGLIKDQAISDEELQHARDEFEAARAALQAAEQQLSTVSATFGGVALTEHPRVMTAAAQLREALIMRYRTQVRAPVSGIIARREIAPGQQVGITNPLLTLVPLERAWVNVNLKESQLANLRVGQPVTMVSDLYGGDVEFNGRVEGLTPGTGSLFSLLPPQNATGNCIKIVQRLSVRVSLDAEQIDSHPLPLGVSLKATINTRDRGGDIITSNTTERTGWRTPVYTLPDVEFDQQIGAVIDANRDPGQQPS